MQLTLPPLSLYVHIPWCVKKCPYCDFNSHSLKTGIPEKVYVTHLLDDLEQERPFAYDRQINSIFIGGGTPSLFSAESIDRLLSGIRSRFTLSDSVEITLEANPGAVDELQFSGYVAAGVNRLSLGVQTFNDTALKQLGRIHLEHDVQRAIDLIQRLSIPSFNLDLMHGLPTQTTEAALYDLRCAIKSNVPHLSWYQLTIEPNTLFGARPPTLPNDDRLWEIYEQGNQALMQAGYQQYETSAYTKSPAWQCQHNLNYWRFGDYVGIGCGAHGKLTQPNSQIIRTEKVRHPTGYMKGNYSFKRTPVELSALPFEYAMNRFRLFEPVNKAEFEQLTGRSIECILPQIDQAVIQGYLTTSPTHWQVTRKGQLFLNSLLSLFL